jgi:hypothetical protein
MYSIPAKCNLIAYLHSDFSVLFTFSADEDITNLEFYSDIENTAKTKLVGFSVTLDTGARTLLLELTDTQVDTIGVGTYNYDVKPVNTVSGKILQPWITGNFSVAYSETEP